VNVITLVALVIVLGVMGAGFARARYPRAPFIVAGAVAAIYLVAIAATGVWSSTCWDCRGDFGESRSDIFYTVLLTSSLVAGFLLLSVWLGARMATMLGRLRRTWDELRGHAPQKHTNAPR
jgi:hypothetical protein